MNYTVYIADNFDFYEGADRYGSYPSLDEAVSAAKAIVDKSLRSQRAQCVNPFDAEELYARWDDFGDSPFIQPKTEPGFSAPEYAKCRAVEISKETFG